jgi:hypothetical protein
MQCRNIIGETNEPTEYNRSILLEFYFILFYF